MAKRSVATDINLASVYLRVDGFDLSPAPDGYVVNQGDRQRVHFLNATAAVIFELCDGTHTVGDIVSLVQSMFHLSEPPADEVRECLKTLVAERLVTGITPS